MNDLGKEALNFQITIVIGYAICIPLILVLIGFPAIVAQFIYHIVASIIAAMKTNEGRADRYPLLDNVAQFQPGPTANTA